VGGDGAETEPERVHPLDVDRRQRSRELARHLERDRDAAAGNADNHRLVEPERGDGFGQCTSGGSAITEERLDPWDDAHLLILPGHDGYQPRPAGTGPRKRITWPKVMA